jgi:hypothetical protein
MSRSRRRWSWSVPLAIVLSLALAGTALAAVSWSAPVRIGPNYTFTDGDPSLASTTAGSTTYLHQIYAQDVVSGNFTFDNDHCCMGVYYARSSNGGSTWTSKRLSSNAYHAERVSLAATGSKVYAVWMSQVHYYLGPNYTYTFDPSEPRYTYLRRSTDNGSTWKAEIKLPGQTTSTAGDYTWVSASGTDVYVTTTDRDTGGILVWRSSDSGQTFTKSVPATTTATDTGAGTYVGGKSGLPGIITTNAGANVMLFYIKDNTGKIVARTSSNDGGAWSTEHVLATSGGLANRGYPLGAALGNRMVVTWTTAGAAKLAIFTVGAGWGTPKTIVTFPDSDPAVGTVMNKGGEGAIPLLKGTSTIGIELPECNQLAGGATCAWDLEKDREQLTYRESANNGTSWSNASIIAKPVGTNKGTFINDFGWGIFVGTTRYAQYNAHDALYKSYTTQISKGTGTA